MGELAIFNSHISIYIIYSYVSLPEGNWSIKAGLTPPFPSTCQHGASLVDAFLFAEGNARCRVWLGFRDQGVGCDKFFLLGFANIEYVFSANKNEYIYIYEIWNAFIWVAKYIWVYERWTSHRMNMLLYGLLPTEKGDVTNKTNKQSRAWDGRYHQHSPTVQRCVSKDAWKTLG